MRTLSRILAFKIIFADLFNENTPLEIENYLDEDGKEIKSNETVISFSNQIVNAYKENKDEIKNQIMTIVTGYELSRIYKVDLALLFLAVTEINYIKTPKPVVINEILEIAKKYSGEKSASFINGVLAKK